MPLTTAHPAAVLPLGQLRLPMCALVAGAMAPDAVLFVAGWGYAVTHSAVGVLTVDVAIALVGLWVWFTLLRDPLADLTPYVRDRVPVHARPDRRGWLLAPVAAAVGAATHVLWDSATHEWGWVVDRLSFLDQDLGPLPVYAWAQQVSTVVGTWIVGAWVVWHLRARPVSPRPVAGRRPRLWLLLPLAAGLLVGVVVMLVGGPGAEGAEYAVAGALQGTVVAALLVSAGWRFRAHPAA